MKTVYKYDLPKVDMSVDVALPFNPGFLCVQVQQGQPVAYVQVDTAISGTNPWRFTAVTTGGVVPPDSRYLGTLMLHDGFYVLHYFATRLVS
jgi:hypothetical protein